RRYLSSVPTPKPRCRQNASRFNPLASNSATSASTSARLRRLRTTPNSLMNQVHHEIPKYNKVRYSDGYANPPTSEFSPPYPGTWQEFHSWFADEQACTA